MNFPAADETKKNKKKKKEGGTEATLREYIYIYN